MNLPALIADDFPTPILSVSPDIGEILWANQSAQEWLGLSLRHLAGKPLSDIFPELSEIKAASARCRASLAAVSLFDFIINRSGKADQKGNVTIFPSGEQITLAFQVLGSQPSESRHSGKAMSAMGRMLAHEIKNPLAGIDGAAQLLSTDVNTDEGRSLINLIRSEINRIRRLADRMETLGDHDPGNVQIINIHELLAKARKIMEPAVPETIRFSETYDPSLPTALGDEDSLLQALINLIKNAVESIESGGNGGEIHLETSFRTGVKRRGSETGNLRQLPIEIRITDTGPGISDDVRNRIFQPFITNKPTGQGLGLALVSKVAAAHGGLIELQSQPGQTMFSILLPAPEKDTP